MRMTTTMSERAKQEADAFKARAWFRDMASEVFGTGEYKESNGKPLKMRYNLRDQRIIMQEEKHKAQAVQKCGTLWSDVTTWEWVGVCSHHHGRDEITDMMDMLIKQTPDIFSQYDEANSAPRFAHGDVSTALLGRFFTDNTVGEVAPNLFKAAPDIE